LTSLCFSSRTDTEPEEEEEEEGEVDEDTGGDLPSMLE
jgi:hypothetical protein